MKPRSAKQKGSRLERKVAFVLGGQRVPLSGAAGGNDIHLPPDNVFRFWGIEVKARKTIPVLIKKALLQAENATEDRHKPAVILGEDRGQPIFVAYLDDVVTWVEGLTEEEREAL